MELLKPKNDVVFHCLFRKGNEKITKALISSIIDEEIEEIELDNDRYLLQSYPEQKIGILDLNAKLDNGVPCNIEIQLLDEGNIEKRILYYWSRLYSNQLKVGRDYRELKKAIVILIADFEIKNLKDIEKAHTKWRIREEEMHDKVLTEDFEIHIIMLPKARKQEIKEDKLLQWMAFLDNPNKEGVLEMKKKNQDIADALWKLEEISEDKKLRRIAELKEKWERDERSAQEYWKENGLEEGRREGVEEGRKEGLKQGLEEGIEQGLEQGLAQGIEQGIEQGREQGEKKAKIEMAKKMLKKNKSIEEIIEMTELAKEEIENLEKE